MNHLKHAQRTRRRDPLWRLKTTLRNGGEIDVRDLPPDLRIREIARMAWRRGCALGVMPLHEPHSDEEEFRAVYGVLPEISPEALRASPPSP